jgi:SRSO17 transposase
METKYLNSVRSRLEKYLKEVIAPIGRSERRKWASQYVQGLLFESGRKTMSGITNRFPEGNSQAIQQMLHFSPWPIAPVLQATVTKALSELKPVEVSIIDDTGIPKKGEQSVGVARQYCGAVGKVENCQVNVSLHYANEQSSFPLDWALYLPQSWAYDNERRRKAGVPPEVRFRNKWELALDLIDHSLEKEIPLGIIVADSRYGTITEFREGLETRKLPYCIGIDSNLKFWCQLTFRKPQPYNQRGRPPKPKYDKEATPETAQQIAERLPEDA